MRKNRRKALIRVIESVALALVVVDVVFWLALLQPLRRLLAAEQHGLSVAQTRLQEQRSRVERLKTFQAALPGAHQQLKVFLRDHIPPRRRAFSRAARLVRRLSEQSGLQLTSLSYRLDSSSDRPLERLGMEVTVEGPYPGLVKFAHTLETASDFILVRDFKVQPGDKGNLALRLGADLYLEP